MILRKLIMRLLKDKFVKVNSFSGDIMKKIIKIILIITCLVSIFMFSSDTGSSSSKKSDSFIVKVLETIKGKHLNSSLRKKYIDTYVVFVRKSAHFTIYFLLGVFVLSLLKEYKILSIKLVLISTFLVFLYACSDEFHQLFVAGRSAEIFDILLDSLGGMVGSCFYYFIRRN